MPNYTLQPRCTVEDAAKVANNNVSAFWQQTWWRIIFAATEQDVLDKVTARTPRNLLAKRETRRHQIVVDRDTGDVVGYARWMLPESHAAAWTEAQTPDVDEADRKRFEDTFERVPLPHIENMAEMDALDEPITENKAKFYPKDPYMQLEYLATHPDHQQRGVSSMLVKSGIDQANKLGIDIALVATATAAVGLYKKHDFELMWELSQSLKPWGHDDVYHTAIFIKHPSKE